MFWQSKEVLIYCFENSTLLAMHFLTEVKWRVSKACKGSRNFLEQLDFIFIWLNNTEHLAELFFTFIVSVY